MSIGYRLPDSSEIGWLESSTKRFEFGDNVAADAHLNMNVWTFEVTQDYQWGPCTMMVAGGLRYAHIAQRYDAVDLTTPSRFVVSGHNFDGIGPTLYVRGRRQCGCSGAYLFGDDCSGRIWALTANGASSQSPRQLLDTSLSISSFGEAENGTLYLTDLGGGKVYWIAGARK